MKEWLSAREIAAEKLPFMPDSERGIQLFAEREDWSSHPYARQRQGRGGGMEYYYLLLPMAAQIAYVQRYKSISHVPLAANDEPAIGSASLSDRAKLERDARLAILASFNDFLRGFQVQDRAHATALLLFCRKYNGRSLQAADWVRDAIPSLSPRTIMRWQAAKRQGGSDRLAVDRGEARKGTGVLDTANGGAVKAHILALIAHQPHLSAAQVLTQCRAEFGDHLSALSKGIETTIDMPPIRTFQHFLKGIKESHKVELLKLTNPDRFRSTMLPSGTGMLKHITEPNALWQIDASPVDALCVDGRHAVYVCIDIATRRFMTYVSKTPKASAVGLLIRKAILAWGVPATIKTDNGSDFVAKETTRLFAALGIKADLSDAYSPAQKGHVERAIGTYQRQFVQLLPGYVGHSVADRKAIEDRKSFAERLGQDTADAFNVSLSSAELQALSDEWCLNVYQHAPHSGLENTTPFARAASARTVIRTVDPRALDVLLMPVTGTHGRRTVTKFGIRIDGNYFRSGSLMPGDEVFVRLDPNDKGRAHVFTLDQGRYLGEAICPELAGIHPETFEKARKEFNAHLIKERIDPIKAEISKIVKGPDLIRRALDVAKRDIPNVVALPKREERHETPEIAAALEVTEPPKPSNTGRMIKWDKTEALDPVVRKTPEAEGNMQPLRARPIPAQRFAQALAIEKMLAEGRRAEIPDNDLVWLVSYKDTSEYRAKKKLHEDFGDQAPVLRT